MPEMQVMLNEIRTRFGRDPDWVPDIALAERLYQIGDHSTLKTLYESAMAGWRPEKIGIDMRIMLNEIRVHCGADPQWGAHVAQAERLYERQDRFALTTLYDTIMAGALPWTPENVRKLKEERAA